MIREYFIGGAYSEYQQSSGIDCSSTSLNQNHCKAFNASGELVKAMLVNSAVGINGWDRVSDPVNGGPSYVTMGMPPDNMQGHGRVMLTRAMPLGNSMGPNLADNEHRYDLFVEDWLTIESNSEYQVSWTRRPYRVDTRNR